ncbi:MAG: DUF2236 domain-containing protein [Actinobacteria bacterium]|nr:DUF2236 domain-containing protein [Actinomycetota bacterium]
MTAGTGPNPVEQSIAPENGTQSPFQRFAPADRLRDLDNGDVRGADLGLFGPDSVTWRIHAHPIVVVGGFRALIIQSLHPLAMAGVAQHSDYAQNPIGRFRRTAQYMHHVVYSDTQTARAAAAHVRKVHEYIKGIDPVTGRSYDANDPELLLWVHCVAAHSCITAYSAYVREIDDAERDRYFAEQVAAAELIGIPRETVPDSTAAYRDYFASMQSSLCLSRAAADTIRFVSRPNMRLVKASEWPFAINLKFAGHASVTLVPRSIREIAGLRKPGPREWALARVVAMNAKALDHALHFKQVANTIDGMTSRAFGTEPLPAAARGHS